MKKLLLILLTFILFGCSKTGEMKIEINMNEPIDKNNTKFIEFLKASLTPIATDSITYIPIVKINRLDKDTLNMKIVVPISTLNSVKKSLGTYTYKAYEKDYQDYLKTMKLPSIVNLPLGDEISFKNEKQFNFFEDSLNLDGGSNSFTSSESLFKTFLQKNNGKASSIIINYHSKKEVVPNEKLDSLIHALDSNLANSQYELAVEIASDLSNLNNTNNSKLLTFSQDLKNRSNTLNSLTNSKTPCSEVSNKLAYQAISIILDGYNKSRVIEYNSKIKSFQKECKNGFFIKIIIP